MRGRVLRASVSVALAWVISSVTSLARADAKAQCFDAAEKAQSLKQSHDLLGARAQLASCVADACPDAVRHDCAGWLAEVDAATPTFSIHARDARGTDVVGARVLLDGAVLASSLAGGAIQANPGPHRLKLETPSGATFELQIELVESQKGRVVEARFDVPLTPDGAAVALSPSPVARVAPPPKSGVRTSTIVAASLGVVAVAGFAVATIFELGGQSAYRDLRDGCAKTGACSGSDVDAAKTKLYVAAPISFAVGVAAAGAAVGIVVFRSSAREKTGLRVDVRPLAGGALGAVSRSF